MLLGWNWGRQKSSLRRAALVGPSVFAAPMDKTLEMYLEVVTDGREKKGCCWAGPKSLPRRRSNNRTLEFQRERGTSHRLFPKKIGKCISMYTKIFGGKRNHGFNSFLHIYSRLNHRFQLYFHSTITFSEIHNNFFPFKLVHNLRMLRGQMINH